MRALRRAVCARAAAIVWVGGDLEGTFAEALPGRMLSRVTAVQPYAALINALKPRAKEWVAITDLHMTAAVNRARWAEAEAGRLGRVVLVEPVVSTGSLPRAGARMITIADGAARLRAVGIESPARLAALLDLSSTAIDDAVKRIVEGFDEVELTKLALTEADPGASPPRLRGNLRPDSATEGLSATDDGTTDARGRVHLPDWPARVELAYRAGDVEVASRWATQWRAANGGARATAALARVRLFKPSINEARALLVEANSEAGENRAEETRFEMARADGLAYLFSGDFWGASRLLREALDRAESLDRDFIDQYEIYEALPRALLVTDRVEDADHLMRQWTRKYGGGGPVADDMVIRPSVLLNIARGDIQASEQLSEHQFMPPVARDHLSRASMDQLSAQVLLAQDRLWN